MGFADHIKAIHYHQHHCPETGRPIVRRPDWLYVSNQHAYTTGIIADSLITTKAGDIVALDGKINIDDMITHTLSLEDINKGFDLMHEGESIRAVVVF